MLSAAATVSTMRLDTVRRLRPHIVRQHHHRVIRVQLTPVLVVLMIFWAEVAAAGVLVVGWVVWAGFSTICSTHALVSTSNNPVVGKARNHSKDKPGSNILRLIRLIRKVAPRVIRHKRLRIPSNPICLTHNNHLIHLKVVVILDIRNNSHIRVIHRNLRILVIHHRILDIQDIHLINSI